MKATPFAAIVVATACGFSGGAFAAPTTADKTTATQLFDDAEKLLASGKVNEACTQYAESQRLDPQLGTLLHLADCYEKSGKTASSWSSFREAGEIAAKRGDPREATARRRAAGLEPKLAKITVAIAGNAPSDIEVRQDGDLVRRAVWGSVVPIDPGAHTVKVSASGYKTWETTVVVNEPGKTFTVNVPALEPNPKAEAKPVAAAPSREAEPHPVAPSRGANGQRTVGLIVGGGGLVAVGVGLAIGAAAKSQYNGANCPNNACVDAAAGDERDQATTKATMATVVFGAGAAALVAGGILWLTAPTSSDPSAGPLRVGVAPGGLVLRGAF
jgi:hypothetical protein